MQSAAASLTPHLLRLLDNLPLMVFAKHAHDLRFAFINRAGAELIGVPANQLLGKTDHDFFPQAQADHFVARDRQVIASGELDIVEEPIETASGARTLRTRKVVLTDEDGAPQFLLGISEDITEARAHDEERQRLNWFLNAVVDNLPVMLFVKHADDLRFALWNRAGADLIAFVHPATDERIP